jgi:pyrroline-5-carboxylate reductase
MGIAITSGVLASIEPEAKERFTPDISAKWESHTPGTSTPTGSPDDTLPSRFIATVSREDTAKKLKTTFATTGSLGQHVEIVAGQNVSAVASSDVVLLW